MAEAVVIGTSAGGMMALKEVLSGLPKEFPLPLVIVQHINARSDAFLTEFLGRESAIIVKEAEDKESLKPGTAYIAPPDYHVLIEPDHSLSLSVDEKVNFSRPSIDVLFQSAADAYTHQLIGVLLTGANGDGAKGFVRIKELGGTTIVQNPQTAEAPYMPQAAIAAIKANYILDLEKIAPQLIALAKGDA